MQPGFLLEVGTLRHGSFVEFVMPKLGASGWLISHPEGQRGTEAPYIDGPVSWERALELVGEFITPERTEGRTVNISLAWNGAWVGEAQIVGRGEGDVYDVRIEAYGGADVPRLEFSYFLLPDAVKTATRALVALVRVWNEGW